MKDPHKPHLSLQLVFFKREVELYWVDGWDLMSIELMQQGQLVPNPNKN